MMVRKMISILILAAFVNCLFGCYSNVNLRQDEIMRPRETGEKIIGVVLLSGVDILFDERGGELNATTKAVAGVTQNGRSLEIRLDEVFYFKVERFVAGRPVVASLAPGEIKAGTIGEPGGKIVAVVEHSGEKITFDNDGGRIHIGSGVVTGKTQDSTSVQILLDEVQYLRIKKFSVTRTILLGATVAAGFVAALLLINSQDLTKGEWPEESE